MPDSATKWAIKACKVKNIMQEGSAESCKEVTMNTSDTLTNFVDQLNAPVFPTSEEIKWTDLVQDTVYQIVSTRTVDTQYGPSIILSFQKADGSCCSGRTCGMLTKELLQNTMVKDDQQG